MMTRSPRYDSSFYLLHRLITRYVRPYAHYFALAVLCMLIVAGTTAMHAWLMQPVLDEVFLKQRREMLLVIPLAVLGVTAIKGIATYGQSVIVKILGQRIVTDIQKELYRHMMRADLGQILHESSGRMISRFTNDIQMLRASVANVLTSFAREVVTLVALLGVMFYQSLTLSLIAFVAFPLGIYPMLRLGKRMRKLSHSRQEEWGNFTERLGETVAGLRVIKSYHREDWEITRANRTMDTLFSLYVKAARNESLSAPVMESLSGIAIAAVIWYGGFQVLNGTTTPGAFFSFMTALIMAYKPMKNLSGVNSILQEGLAAARRLFELFDQTPTILEAPHATPLIVTHGAIEFRDVTFRYLPDRLTLDRVCLTIPAGKTIALVGPSGGGKTTLMNLLLRLYDIESGAITIDGQDLRDVTFASLRQSMAIVSQDTMLFDDSVAMNIAYGAPDATRAAIEKAAEHAAAAEFIRALPNGFDTRIGPNGVSLSGGQRQRIAIARAMLKNAPILLLDEATSALDTLSEQHIQRALTELMQGRTTLVIAHRLSTVMDADCIYVLAQGRIAEQGTHSELLARGGVYASLYQELSKDG